MRYLGGLIEQSSSLLSQKGTAACVLLRRNINVFSFGNHNLGTTEAEHSSSSMSRDNSCLALRLLHGVIPSGSLTRIKIGRAMESAQTWKSHLIFSKIS